MSTKKPRTEHYDHNVRFAKKPRKPQKKRRFRELPPYMTITEKDRFFRVISSPRDRAVFRLLYHHGLRASEIRELQYSDYRPGSRIELDRILIHRLKGSISGECAVVPGAALAVRAWLRIRGIRPGPLFPSRKKSPLSRIRIFELMQRYCRLAEIPAEKAHPHSLKHSCCTHLVSDQKLSLMDVKTHVGHVNIRSTMVYTELTAEANEERARKLRDWK